MSYSKEFHEARGKAWKRDAARLAREWRKSFPNDEVRKFIRYYFF